MKSTSSHPPASEVFKPVTISITLETHEEFLAAMAIGDLNSLVADVVAKRTQESYPKLGVSRGNVARVGHTLWAECRKYSPNFVQLQCDIK